MKSFNTNKNYHYTKKTAGNAAINIKFSLKVRDLTHKTEAERKIAMVGLFLEDNQETKALKGKNHHQEAGIIELISLKICDSYKKNICKTLIESRVLLLATIGATRIIEEINNATSNKSTGHRENTDRQEPTEPNKIIETREIIEGTKTRMIKEATEIVKNEEEIIGIIMITKDTHMTEGKNKDGRYSSDSIKLKGKVIIRERECQTVQTDIIETI